jgi:hypothetical protein
MSGHINFTHAFYMDTNEVGTCQGSMGRLFLELL